MRSKAMLLGLMGLAAALSSSSGTLYDGKKKYTEPTDEDIKKDLAKRELQRRNQLLKRGLQLFVIDGKEIYARDYKNALRKSKKK